MPVKLKKHSLSPPECPLCGNTDTQHRITEAAVPFPSGRASVLCDMWAWTCRCGWQGKAHARMRPKAQQAEKEK